MGCGSSSANHVLNAPPGQPTQPESLTFVEPISSVTGHTENNSHSNEGAIFWSPSADESVTITYVTSPADLPADLRELLPSAPDRRGIAMPSAWGESPDASPGFFLTPLAQRLSDEHLSLEYLVTPLSMTTGADAHTPSKPLTATASEINNLPLEQYYTAEDLSSWKIGALKQKLESEQQRSSSNLSNKSGQFPRQPPLEKPELIQAVLDAAGGSSSDRCAICFEEYLSEEFLRVLPCGHRYHIECIDRWLKSKSIFCPLCNQSITREVCSSCPVHS
mmetsp:Transcript_19551/g.23449  ORF Transcript_19551/g.23449 Transcript_19551/m.23449 type:complete len:277 (-) Transcript_19551:34-864(-)